MIHRRILSALTTSAENQSVSSSIALNSGRNLYSDMKQSHHQMTILLCFLVLKSFLTYKNVNDIFPPHYKNIFDSVHV